MFINFIYRSYYFKVGGILYGWPAFVFILQEEGIFSGICNQSNTEFRIPVAISPMHNQDVLFNTIFIIGCAVCGISGLFFGI